MLGWGGNNWNGGKIEMRWFLLYKKIKLNKIKYYKLNKNK